MANQRPPLLYFYLPLATLQANFATWNAASLAIASGQQEYSIAGRTFRRGDLGEINRTLEGYAYAIAAKTGQVQSITRPDMSY